MVAVPVQSALILYVPVSSAKSDVVGVPPITTKSFCVNFPFPSKSVIATPFWGTTTPGGPGRNSPEMVWPYLPVSDAFEHAAACAADAAASVRHAAAAANVVLQNHVFIFLSPQSSICWALRPQSSRADCCDWPRLAMARI